MIKEIRSVNVSSKRQITIPSEFKKIKAGDKAVIVATENEIIIKPMKQVEKKLTEELIEKHEPAIASEKALAEAWNSKEDKEAFEYLQ